MYRFYINNIDDEYHFTELARVFLPDDGFEIITYRGNGIARLLGKGSYLVNAAGESDREAVKREFYGLLSEITGMRPPWGTLTGVRPLKPALAVCEENGVEEMERLMKEKYLMSDDKASLLADIADYQLKNITGIPWEKASLYAGIPFCPTRCAYCSFASNVAPEADRERYLEDLLREVSYAGRLAKENGTKLESMISSED